MNLYPLARPLLFSLSPEKAHDFGLLSAGLMPTMGKWFRHGEVSQRLTTKLGHHSWRSPIGLAAGLDKNAQAVGFFHQLGLGAIEVGTVTLAPQIGNPRPRIHRYPHEASLRNSMGFPNAGSEQLLANIKRLSREQRDSLYVNIGKSKDSSASEAIDEYCQLYEKFASYAQAIVINISSPNTQGLRDLQQEGWLKELLSALTPFKQRWHTPIWLKLSPDLADDSLSSIIPAALNGGINGLVATNTTIMPERGVGGVSGKLLKDKATLVRRKVLQLSEGQCDVIGVGGVDNLSDFLRFWHDGGKCMQIYTALIYHGPSLVAQIEQDMLAWLKQSGLNDLNDLWSLSLSQRQKLLTSHGP